MVEALVQGLKGGGNNGGYILRMCSGHSLVASYSSPNFFSSHFGGLQSLVLFFLFEYTNLSFIKTLQITLIGQAQKVSLSLWLEFWNLSVGRT